MTLKNAIEPWAGLIAGAAVIGIASVLYIAKVLPPSVAGIILTVGGGLTAGLFTRGTAVKGALVGIVMGFLAVAGMVIWLISAGGPSGGFLPNWVIIGGFALIVSVIFVPANTISGITGVLV